MIVIFQPQAMPNQLSLKPSKKTKVIKASSVAHGEIRIKLVTALLEIWYKMNPFPPEYSKQDVAQKVLDAAGVEGGNAWGYTVESQLMEASGRLERKANKWVQFVSEANSEHLALISMTDPSPRTLGYPDYLNGRPDYFPPSTGDYSAFEDVYGYVKIENGYFATLPDFPAIFDDQQLLLRNVGSRFKDLVGFYDYELRGILNAAPFYDEVAFVILDDIWDFNYCHWLCDWLPRLAIAKQVIGDQRFKVIVNPIATKVQIESLVSLGIDESDILPFNRLQAGKFRTLIVPNNLGIVNHPSHSGADWSLNYLRDNILAAADKIDGEAPEKIYISRNDAPGRRLVNEVEFEAEIQKYGYKTIVLSKLSFLQQVKVFSKATHVIGIHGAGLTNIIFSLPGKTKFVELTPISYGMPSFFVLAAALKMKYATYICPVKPGVNIQQDSLIIDVADFMNVAHQYIE